MEKKDYRLSYDFSDRVMDKINSEIMVREKRKEALVMVGSILSSVLAVAATLLALIYFNILSISLPSVSLPSISVSLIFDTVKSYLLFLVVGINIIILYIIGERLAIRRPLREVSHLPS